MQLWSSLHLRKLGNFSHFIMSSAYSFQNQFSIKKIISGIPLVSNGLDPDQAKHSVDPYQSPDCLQRLSIDNQFHCFGDH